METEAPTARYCIAVEEPRWHSQPEPEKPGQLEKSTSVDATDQPPEIKRRELTSSSEQQPALDNDAVTSKRS